MDFCRMVLALVAELVRSLHRPVELAALLRLMSDGRKRAADTNWIDRVDELDDEAFCYAALDHVSRSFAAVIRQLPADLRFAVCIYYLVLRGLDSVEDDMALSDADKQELLEAFHTRLEDPDFALPDVGDTPDYRRLMAHFPKVVRSLHRLDAGYRDVIVASCRDMAEGMRIYSGTEIRTGADWDRYCHYVAGLVGYGLSDLFAASGRESESLPRYREEANAMGLFLQKTNIIRDYPEDLAEGRVFWPAAAWQAAGDTPAALREPGHEEVAVDGLNRLVADALRHLPDCLRYLGRLQDPAVYRFCAIPQVMAAATLAEIYDNPGVFHRMIKIRKGLAARILLEVDGPVAARRHFERALRRIERRARRRGDEHAAGRAGVARACLGDGS